MNKTFHQAFCARWHGKQFLTVLFFLFLFTRPALAQTPYITLTSGGTCLGESANLAIVGATATSWTVTPYVAGGITNAGPNSATINCIQTGTYTLNVTYINGPSGQPTGTLSLQTTIPPTVTPTLSVTPSATTACVGSTVTYTPTATNYGTLVYCKWYVDNVYITQTWNQPFITNSLSAGTHTITAILSSTAPCATPNTVSVNTTTTILSGLNVSNNTSICPGGSATLTANGGSSYTWSPSTGLNTTTGATVIASPATTTTYTVTGTGCAAPKQVTVTVNTPSALAGSPCAPPSGTSGGSFGGTSVRNRTPVVLTGGAFASTNVNSFIGTDMVAFAYNAGSGTWTQVPLQVDERKVIDAGTIYNTATTRDSFGSGWGTNQYYSVFSSLQYCDANTWVGTDPTATFDNDDEVVFMARDAGGGLAPSGTPYPTGVVATSGAQIAITDPNNSSAPASYIYIFKKSSTGGLQQSAGKSYVNYNFSFKVGSTSYGPTQYKANYGFYHHLENSNITTPYYQIGFSDRWIEDLVKVTVANSASIDMIDRHRNQFNNGCENEDSFSTCEGAYITNKSGPVRAIRSHMGACSGALTQREFIFYDQFETIKTDLRVHQLPGMMDFWDYNPGAGQMRYSNNNNTTGGTLDPVTGQTGIPVDGSPDVVTAGPLTWEMMSSASGTIFRHYKLTTDINPGQLALTSYYLDTNTPSTSPSSSTFQCPGGDGKAWGSSGMFIDQSGTYTTPPYNQLPMTDPRNNALTYTNSNGTFPYTYNNSYYQNMQLIETNLFLKPATSRTEATALVSNVTTPLAAVVSKWPIGGGGRSMMAENEMETTDSTNVAVSLYPNPSDGLVTIEAKGAKSDKILAVFYNGNGKEIYRTQSTGSMKQLVNLHAPAGIGQLYIAKIYINGKVYTRKLIISK